MDISIKFINTKPTIIDEMKYCVGEIQIGHFKETLDIPVEYWSIKDYEKQWKEGLERIKNHESSCLIVSALDSQNEKSKSIDIWGLYKDKKLNKIYIQNYFLILKELPKRLKNVKLTPETSYKFIYPRNVNSDVSEWEIDIE